MMLEAYRRLQKRLNATKRDWWRNEEVRKIMDEMKDLWYKMTPEDRDRV